MPEKRVGPLNDSAQHSWLPFAETAAVEEESAAGGTQKEQWSWQTRAAVVMDVECTRLRLSLSDRQLCLLRRYVLTASSSLMPCMSHSNLILTPD